MAMRCEAWQKRSRTASARVGSAIEGCHLSTGSWLATTVERSPERSSTTSKQVPAGLDRGRAEQEVVEDEHADPGQLGQRAGVTAVGPAEGQVVQ